MTLPAPLDLLRSIHRHLDRQAVCDDFPNLTQKELDQFILALASVCQGMDSQGQGQAFSGAALAPGPSSGGGGADSLGQSGSSAPTMPFSGRRGEAGLFGGETSSIASKAKTAGGEGAVTLFTDGGSRGNPGPAGYGFVLYDGSGREIRRGKRFLGRATNNVAEYEGVAAGLRAALEAGAKSVTLKSDSQLIVMQLRGTYRVKAAGLKNLFAQVKSLLARFASWQAVHVRREQNQLADALANEAMDGGRCD